MRLSDQALRGNLIKMTPTTCKGVVAVYGFDSGQYAPEAFASNQFNEEQALLARVLADTIVPVDNEIHGIVVGLKKCIQFLKSSHEELFPNVHNVKSYPFATYLERSNASPSVKKILLNTHLKLVEDGVSEDTCFGKTDLYRMTYRSSFVKVENNLYLSPDGRKEKAPRLIQGATPEFICLVGPWIMALQDVIKRRWDGKHGPICFTSGLSAEQVSDFIESGLGQPLEDDLGKFDCSIRREWCEYEVWLCKKFGAPRAVLDLMRENINTHGRTCFGWSYKCDGTRKSGDPYTSLMNSIINAGAHIYLYCAWTGKTVSECHGTFWEAVQGDDNFLRHLEACAFNWQAGMATLGLDSEAVYRDELYQAEFCSNRLWPVEGRHVLGPKPGKVLAKFGYIVNPPLGVTRESMMRGVALGLVQNCHFIPPLNSLIERVLELTEGHEAYLDKRERVEHKSRVSGKHVTSTETWLALNSLYHWDHAAQASWEKSLKTMELGDPLPQIAWLLLDRDTSGPAMIFN